jgi:hypothetical protein
VLLVLLLFLQMAEVKAEPLMAPGGQLAAAADKHNLQQCSAFRLWQVFMRLVPVLGSAQLTQLKD